VEAVITFWVFAGGFTLGALCERLWGRRLRAAGRRAADRLLARLHHQ
jgi:hypothetical protein